GSVRPIARGALPVRFARTAAKPVHVRRAGTTWQCQERPGDPNPYQACVDAQDHTRLVTLSS
ncbi:hypothetical protein ACFC18_50620, partial [Streptomyces sp. NPDC056121]